jgi:formate hydrogenlyase subunit 3/multisubunit Na+/H+ antiporter MnhD subunit
MAFSANLVTMFVFYEILTVSTYALVAHDETPEAIQGGHKYLVYLLSGGAFLLFATLMTYSLVGTTDFDPQGILGPALGPGSRLTLQLLFFCFMLGFVKAAWMPIHSWLPTAMVAPTPVSALLHAVAVVKAGVFGIIKTVFYLYGTDLMHELGLGIALACVASFTIIVANLQAIGQNNLKRLLAYSTINQLSFIILGAAILTPMSATGALIHIPFHGFMKITLFLCAGAIAVIAQKKNVSEMAGVGRQMPITMIAFTIAALGMCGAPPVAGFISKWHISLGAIEAGQTPFLFPVHHPGGFSSGCRVFLSRDQDRILRKNAGGRHSQRRYGRKGRVPLWGSWEQRERTASVSLHDHSPGDYRNLLHPVLSAPTDVPDLRTGTNGRQRYFRR